MKKLALKTIAMPKDTNPRGDIFGGWLMSQMDLGGAVVANKKAGGRCATVAVSEIQFLKPVHIGDVVSCYSEIIKIGNTSITVKVEVMVDRGDIEEKVTEGTFVYVALDKNNRPRPAQK